MCLELRKIIMEKLLLLLPCVFMGISASLDPDIVALLTEEAGKIPKSKLADAFYVRQNVESEKILYLHHKQPVFSSKNVDQKEKSVIVLNKKEDGLDDCGEKTTYVVLILNDKASNKYIVQYAYFRSKGKTRFIEWDSYGPRGGSARNKAFIFGHEHCTRSILTSCKLQRPDNELFYSRNLNVREKRTKNDFVCDVVNTVEEAQLAGAILTSLNMAVTILAGADLIYKDEMQIQKDVVQQLLIEQKKKMGRGFSSKSNAILQNITEAAAGKFIEDAKQSLSTGVFMFYLLLGSIGQLAEKLIHLDFKEGTPQFEEIRAEMRKKLGTRLLEGLFTGNYDIRKNASNPFPGLLLKEDIARQIMFGGQDEEEDDEEEQKGTGRRLVQVKGRLTVGQRPLKANENVNTALTTSKEKSAGQIFATNAKSGFYAPYGVIEAVGDVIGQAAGIGKINEERTLLDQGIDTILNIGTKAMGGVVDVAANILKPFGLGPLSKIAAGIGGAALGLTAGIASCEKVCAVMLGHQALKIGAKLFGLGGFLGNKKKKKPPPDDAQFAELYAKLEAQMSITDGEPPVGVLMPPPPLFGVAVQPQPLMMIGQPQPVGVQVVPGAPQPGIALTQGAPQPGVPLAPGAPQPGVPLAPGAPPTVSLAQGPPALPLEMETELDMFTIWGWISQSLSVQNLWVDTKEPDFFIGFGTSYLQIKPENGDIYEKILTYESYIDFLILLLRIENRNEMRKQIVYLVTKDYVTYDQKTKTFLIHPKSPVLSERTLSSEEEIDLYLSFELVAFSKAYKSLAEFLLILNCPSGERISKSVALVQLMTQEYLSLIFTYGDVHLVKLLRNYGYTLKTMYTKSLQDVYRFNTCKKCSPASISLVDNNAITLYALMQFVLYGSWDYYITTWTAGVPGPETFQPIIITPLYNTYFTQNRNDFITDVSNYII